MYYRLATIYTDEVVLTGLIVVSNPSKLEYVKDELIDVTGVVLRAQYSDGSSRTVTNFTYTPTTPLTVDDTDITFTYSEKGKSKSVSVPITVLAEKVLTFGVMWDYGVASPNLMRLNPDNDPYNLVNTTISGSFVPQIGDTQVGSSPFDEYYPWNKMRSFNVEHNAITYRQDEDGFSFTKDTFTFIPEYYYKVIDNPDESKRYYYICQKEREGFTKHPGSKRCLGRYECNNSYATISGSKSITSITRAQARTGIHNHGGKQFQNDYLTWCAYNLLMIVETASWDSQSVISRGYVDGNSGSIMTGQCDGLQYHSGRPAGTNGKTAVIYRNIENPWGNIYKWVDGINFNNSTVYICYYPPSFADNTTTDYTEIGTKIQNDGFISKWKYSNTAPFAFFPEAVSGSNTTYVCDYAYYLSGWRVLSVGGHWSDGSYAGAFYFSASHTASYSNSRIGARAEFLPDEADLIKLNAD